MLLKKLIRTSILFLNSAKQYGQESDCCKWANK